MDYAELITTLAGKYRDGSATVKERVQLEQLLDLLQLEEMMVGDEAQMQRKAEAVWAKLEPQLQEDAKQMPVHRVRPMRRAWVRYAAAVIIIVGSVAYLWNYTQKEKPSVTQHNPVPVKNDVAPGGNKATLTLADGSTIDLDDAKAGELAKEGNATITKTEEGKIEYQSSVHLSSSILFNTVATPRGGQYQLKLPDGSRVWLNAESSITYPVAFTTSERKVKISGEVYFEVSKDKRKPFIVETGEETITVLGTEFNVNTYKTDGAMKVSLVEGSVKIRDKQRTSTLTPGNAYQNGKISSTDIAEDVAWKNGKFLFANSSIEAIMNQVSRWYDVDIEYESKVTGNFAVDVPRDVPVSKLLQILELTDKVHFTIERKKIIVRQ